MVPGPATKPVTIPVVEPILAMVGLLAVHIPPVNALLRVIGVEIHTELEPLIGAIAFTVKVVVAVQPVTFTTYDIIVVPAETPVAEPETDPIVAIAVLLLLHVPLPDWINV